MAIQRQVRWDALWKGATRLGGLFIMLHEALSPNPTERPVLYIAALTMMGITITIPKDKQRQENGE